MGMFDSISDAIWGTSQANAIGLLEDKQQELLDLMRKAKNDRELKELRAKYRATNNLLMDEYKRQGLVNPDGSLKSITEFMPKEIDKDFLRLAREQGREARDIASQQGMIQNNIDRASGKSQPMGALASNLEGRIKLSMNDMLDRIKSERELAYNKAKGEVGRKENFARTYTADQRNMIQNLIGMRKEEIGELLGYTKGEMDILQNKVLSMEDGILDQVMQNIGPAIAGYITGGIGGAVVGVAGNIQKTKNDKNNAIRSNTRGSDAYSPTATADRANGVPSNMSSGLSHGDTNAMTPTGAKNQYGRTFQEEQLWNNQNNAMNNSLHYYPDGMYHNKSINGFIQYPNNRVPAGTYTPDEIIAMENYLMRRNEMQLGGGDQDAFNTKIYR